MTPAAIQPTELQRLLTEGRPVRVLDIRDREAHEEWRIPGSQHLPWGGDGDTESGEGVECSSLRGEGPIVVVCARGRSSRTAARAIRERCGLDARSLEGGMAEWSLAWNTAEVEDSDAALAAVQLRRTGKGCLSYLLGAGGEAVVIDPSLAPDVYRRVAASRGWTIKGVVETHVHADHLSRGRKLAEAEGVPHCLPADATTEFEHHGLEGGDRIPVGDFEVEVLHTPGHTSAGLTYRAGDRFLFTGDTLFLESVGRPDLEARDDREQARSHARRLHRSLSELLALDAGLTVLPAHTSEPVAFDGEPVAATLAEVRERVDVADQTEDEFVRELVDAIPSTPPNYERIVDLNERGEFPEDDLVDLEAGANRCAAG